MNAITDQLIYYYIWKIVFKKLDINDLLNCRLVNKKFKEFSDHSNGINKLIIGRPFIYGYEYDFYWYYNYRSLEDNDVISLKCFRTIKKLKIFNLDKYLKYLKIYDQQFKLEEISKLINLQSIEFSYYNCKKEQILNSNNLKVFVSSGRSVQLNTPKLEKIQFNDINKIKLNSNTESIKYLITQNYDNKLEIFKNLEIMELRNTGQPMNENLLIIFNNLQQLKIRSNSFNNYSNELIKNSLIKILNDKIKSKRAIDIYLEGVKIESIDKFNELVSVSKFVSLEEMSSIGFPYWKFRLNNYDLLDLNLSLFDDLTYRRLEECVNNIKNDLPSSFFDKFIHINGVRVNYHVKDIDGLNWFLNKLKYLIRLYILSDIFPLEEVFYNKLPNTIKYLYIFIKEDINYDFILKLSKLIEFCTVDSDLFDLAFESFSNLKYLNYFKFDYKNKAIKIKKKGKYFYLNTDERRKLDYNQLMEECNEIRSK